MRRWLLGKPRDLADRSIFHQLSLIPFLAWVDLRAAEESHDVTFFAGQLMFGREQWWHGVLHNQTAFALQKRLQWDGFTMVILPVRIH